MKVKKILGVRRYKAGYEVRHELHDGSEYGGEDFDKKVAYNPRGHYIGDPKTAHRLCVDRGIRPEVIGDEHHVCSIGFSPEKWRWYGWSHRAIYGFGVGSKVKMGDCAFVPSNKEEFLESLRRWHDDACGREAKLVRKKGGVLVKVTSRPKDGGTGLSYENFERYPDEWGRGEWTAETLEDARQMAIDFARSVS